MRGSTRQNLLLDFDDDDDDIESEIDFEDLVDVEIDPK